MSSFFAGLGWASQTHAVCVIDEQGGVAERLEVALMTLWVWTASCGA